MTAPQPVTWRVGGWTCGASDGRVGVLRANEEGVETGGYCLPDVAESRALALIMAAAVARGEQGHTGALNRVVVVLGGEPARDGGSLLDVVGALADAGISTAHRSAGDVVRALVAERDRWRELAEGRESELGDHLQMPGEAFGALIDDGLRPALAELRSLRSDVEAACVRLAPYGLHGDLGEKMDGVCARLDYLGRARKAMSVPGSQSVGMAARMVARERDALEGERDRLRAELAEAREALAGKTVHDAAAEVVAPLREALGCDTSDMVPAGVVEAAAAIVREALDSTPLAPKPARITGPCDCCAAEDRISIDPETGEPCRVCDGMGWVPKSREPMTHASLASIEQHGVVVGDSIEWAGGMSTGKMLGRVEAQGLTARCESIDRYVVEAPDAD